MVLTTLLSSMDLSRDASSAPSLFDETESRMSVKYGSFHVSLDGQHPRHVVQRLLEDGELSWTDGYLLVYVIMH